ncbi:MAG: protein kinase domain-containing protein, partial [Polyangiaceae bacterium]
MIGSGAMGAVYRARQVALDKTVAIKVLHGEHADDPTFAARFQREAKAASRMNHPNSMQVIDFGQEPDGLLYIAMEYLDGRSLHRVLREDGAPSPARIVDILMQTLAALAAAHDMGVVHRDLKPENIVVLLGADDDGRPRDVVKVCDFGIAKITDSRAYKGSSGERNSDAPVTTAGFLVGTPEYMSPEQGRGDRLDARSDVYSAGVVLFEMLTGRVPFEAENAIGVVLKHITEDPPRPSSIAPGVDAGLEAVCMRAMRKRLEDRYPSAREMRADLRAAMEGRALQSSTSDLPSVTVRAAGGATATAATVEMETLGMGRGGRDSTVKPTLSGAAVPIARHPGRVFRVAVVATLCGIALAVVLAVLVRAKAKSAPPVQAVADPSAAPAVSLTALDPGVAPALPPLEPGPPDTPPEGLHPGEAVRAGEGARPAHATSVVPGHSAPPSPTQAAPVTAAVGTTTALPTTPPPATAAPAATPPDPSFDPGRAYVEVGLVNAQGVRESAVRGALRGVGLAGCYRRALKTRGARVTGVATLSLSIDENGATRSAIVVGADFLPGLARCIQGASSGVGVPRSQVDSGGGT